MEKRLEVATIQADCDILNGYELSWFVSRSQLEFIMQNVEVIHSPPFVATARYQEKMLPVLNLEDHFGLAGKYSAKAKKYLVLKAANSNHEMSRLIIETPFLVKIQKLEKGFAACDALVLPKNNGDILGVYSLSATALAIVPDIAGIAHSLKLHEDIAMQQ